MNNKITKQYVTMISFILCEVILLNVIPMKNDLQKLFQHFENIFVHFILFIFKK